MDKNIEAIYPLSPTQEGMLFHTLYAPESTVYMEQDNYLLRNVDADALHKAWQQVVARHPVLRTLVLWETGRKPLQVVRKQVDLPWVQLDWRGVEAELQTIQLAHFLEEDRASEFALQEAPLMRCTLIQLSERDFHFVWSHHHLILDGWSVPILLDEVFAFYGALCQGESLHLPQPRPYREYIGWLQKQDSEAAKTFWQSSLRGIEAAMPLPERTTSSDPKSSEPEYGRVLGETVEETLADEEQGKADVWLSEELTQSLRVLGQQNQLTLSTLVQGAWAFLLGQYSREEKIIFGVTVSGRPAALPGVESMVGLFINTIPAAVTIDKEMRSIEWLQQLQDQNAERESYAYSSLPDIQGWSDVPRSVPLFESIVVFENFPADPSNAAQDDESDEEGDAANGEEIGDPSNDFEISGYQNFEQTNYPITLVSGANERLLLRILYDIQRFDRETIERALSHLVTILQEFTRQSTEHLSHIQLLDAAERETILVDWNETARAYPKAASVQELFEEQVRKEGQAVAIVDGDTSLTYSELNDQANQLARSLQKLGVKAEQPVGICVERSPRLIIGMLAILKAGGIYVPLDSSYPAERLAFMLEDTQTQVVISENGICDVLPQGIEHLLLLDDEACIESCAQESPENLTVQVNGENLAYIIYTSGSTGQPKGVMVPHQAINRLVINTDYIDFAQVETIGQASNASFDAATFEVWGALLNGAKLVMIDKDTALSPEGLANQIASDAIDTLFLTTALFNQIAAAYPTAFAGMRYMLFGGEAVDPSAVARVIAQGKPAHLLHVYGPTESTTYATWHDVVEVAPDAATVPIGRPIANTTAYILDSEMHPVPVGVAGELYIGGDGLARGYWQREELTRERFVQVGKLASEQVSTSASGQVGKSDGVQPANLQTCKPANLLYKTGDLARWTADGTIEFMGRLDHQVKIRGFRIELGEIENCLSQHENVQESMVLALEDPQGNKRLVGYIVGTDQSPSSRGQADQNELFSELRSYLGNHLPDYMVPTGFVLLRQMPLTPNGKVDRKALTALADDMALSSVEYVAPRTSVEEELVALWQDVLQVAQIGIHDNFFELGGHSLLATQLVSHIRKSMETELPLRLLFENPTVAELAVAMSQQGSVIDAPPIIQVEERENLPLSYAQQRLWFLDQLEGPSATYNVPLAVQLSGQLDTHAFERAINHVIARHEALRTTFTTFGGEPIQQIHEELPIPLEIESFSHLGKAEQEAALENALNEVTQRPFDLEAGPLLRVHLFVIDSEAGESGRAKSGIFEEEQNGPSAILVVVMHHIISDGWSLNVFLDEVGLLYDLYSSVEASSSQANLYSAPFENDRAVNTSAPFENDRKMDAAQAQLDTLLPPLAIQYADFAVWQRNWLQGEVLEQALAYWRNQLAGTPDLLELPTDYPRPPIQSFDGSQIEFTLDAELAHGLQEIGSRTGSTLFMILMAAYSTLLGKYSRQDDITVGTPIANRNRAEIEPLIGFFVNTLVMRTDLSEDPTFEALLAQVQQTALDAYAYQDVPFEQVVEALDPVRSMSYSPLFQHLFVLQNASDLGEEPEASPEDGLGVAPVSQVAHTVAKFDTTLSISESGTGELLCAWEYSTALFEEATIRRMIGHFTQLLRSIVADPTARLSALAMLEEKERNDLLEVGQPKEHFRVDHALHTLFEEQVRVHPNQVAVTYEDESLTYSELNQRANQVAHRLLTMGVTPESHVGLCLERSIELIVGVLAILKAGGAYVPLDPASPAARLDYIMEDAGISVLLTQASLTEALPEREKLQRLLLEDGTLSGESTHNPNLAVSPEHLAYIIYTSGSTGQPKGVMVEHQQVVRLFTATESLYGFNSQDVWSLFHSIAFDFSVWELWGALLYGGRLVVVPYWVSRSSDDFYQLLIQEQVTVLNQTPSAFNSLQVVDSAADEEQAVLNLRWIIFGGEALTLENLRGWFQRHGDSTPQLVNMYGITETTVHVTYRIITQADVDAGRGSLIGQPISDLSLHILDSKLNPVPVGVPGELIVGGAGVARGYHNRPELTSERFITIDDSSRLYRSGDLARRLADGDIEYLGRIDHQVKIRGFRIELGEIESVLLDSSHVAEASVLAVENERGDDRLVAYVVPQLEATRAASESDAGASPEQVDEMNEAAIVSLLRTHLQERLPEYIVPAGFVLLEEMPLTNNGKLDRRTLLRMADGVVGSSVDYVAPRTEAEKTLVTLWQAVLEVEQVGIHDNFFELGGHSLLATRLTSQIRSQLEVEVPLRVLFAGPTVADLAYNLNELDTANSAPPITPTENREAIPLSFAQQRLWFLDQLEGPNAIYNVPMAVRLTGTLDLALFERAINEIVARHEVLRTTFGIDVNAAAGEPVQQIHDQIHIPLQMQDFSQLGGKDQEAAQEAALEAAIVSGSEAPFDLANGPLLTVHLFQTAADDAVLLIVMHHIISDGWSVNIFWEELAILYGAYISNVESPLEPPLEPLTVQYADFAIWQRNWLSGEVLERELGYWREKLAGLPELLELPTDHPRPPIQSFSGRTDHFMLTPTLTSKLHELSQHTGSTLFMTLLAAYAALLSRYSRQDDIAVGTPIANRNRAEIEPLIGFFVNTLVMRTHLSEDLTFAQLLEQVQETALDAYAHQDLPFDQVVEAVDPVRSMSHTPLFQHMFTLETLSAAEEAGTEVTPEAENEEGGDTSDSPFDLEVDMAQGADYTIAKFDLTLGVAETTDGLACSWEYNTDLFESATIERMNRHFEQLLLSITDAPDAPLATLSLLDDIERDEIVVGWNETARDYPTTATVHELFEAQAQTDGDAIAIVDGETVLTYAELNSQANQLAHHLRTLGVSLEEPVGICVERSPRLVVGMLAILKAGGVYVPLDTSYPAERLAFMLQDTSTQVVISEQSLLEVLPEDISQLLLLDDETCLQSCDQQSSANLSNDATGENLAYIIYTSGSTGRPKGVMVPHQAVNRLVINTDYVDFSQVRAIGQASNASFDAATFEVWGALLNGAKLVIIDKETALSPEGLANQIAEDAIDTLFLTTALFNQIAAAHPTAFATMRYMLFGGEAVDPNAVARIVSLGKPEHLLHVYGPTESTTYATWHEVEAVESDVVTIPIGRPIANTTAYILDSELNPVPVGVPGELYIGGDGLARGYWQREELTAERFVQVGMSSSGQVKKPDNVQAAIVLYKTGDLVRWNADGAIEFMGRLDHQVKLRGFRIELGEIESYLSQHEQVQESMVLALDDPQGNKRLIGYIVTTTDQSTNNQDELADALRSHLRSHLPDYMVPSGFVLLDEMPLTPNGKVDRKALTGLADEALGSSVEYVAPRTAEEEALVALWQEVLQSEPIGIHDNFFELGGHSLLATQLISHIRSELEIELPLRALFEGPTVAELAIALTVGTRVLSAPPIVQVAERKNLPLSFAQQRLWFLDQLEGPSATYNVPLAVDVDGGMDTQAFERAINYVVARHEALRTTFTTLDGEPVQTIHDTLHVPLHVESFDHFKPADREEAITEALSAISQQPFDLAVGPLLRVHLLQIEVDHGLLIIVMHHIISDGWSLNLFMEEVGVLYELFSSDEDQGLAKATEDEIEYEMNERLPELPVQYADFAVWQRNWLQGEVLDEALGYWRNQLAGAPELLELPTDRPRPAIQTFQGNVLNFTLEADVALGLQALGSQTGSTLFMTLLAAYSTLLSKYSRQDDIAIGTPIANRNRVEIEPLIGFFVNTLVMRTDLSENPTFEDLLAQVKQRALDAYKYQDVPFEQVVDALDPVRSMSYPPLFQHFFVLQNASSLEDESDSRGEGEREEAQTDQNQDSGFALTEGVAHTIAKFDTTLSISEGTNGELICAWEYNTDLFDEATIRRMVSHFGQLLRSIIAQPKERISTLTMLESAEQGQLLAAGQQRARFAVNHTLHGRFEQQAIAGPNQIAVTYESQSITYDQLNRRANQVAHRLVQLGVTTESHVGLCVERSIDMVVGVLAILKAGGAYVPLDPASPATRLAYILKDAGISVLLTQEGASESLPQDETLQRLFLDDESLGQESDENLTRTVTTEDLAYIIYTSGSTGQPKGVMVEHQQVARLFTATESLYSFNEQDVWTLFHSIAFDFSVWELWGALLYGGRLVVVPYWISRSPDAFYDLLIREQVTVLNQTPSAFNSLQAADQADYEGYRVELNGSLTNGQHQNGYNQNGQHQNSTYSNGSQRTNVSADKLSLRWIIFGGEALALENLRGWFERHGDNSPQLVNMYGITETTVHVTYRIITRADVDAGRGSLIGQPISDLSLYILDAAMNPVPVGVAGELYVGGAGVARGYHNRLELNKERFVRDCFADNEGRLYRSGDLARRLPDGDIEYLGRIDQQVKIRGFRIELGEIESALLDYHYVAEASVLALDDGQGMSRLVAYVIPQLDGQAEEHDKERTQETHSEIEDSEIDEATAVSMLRSHLREQLPEYMIPSSFVFLEEMPLTNNGKLDRRILATMADNVVGSAAEYVAPRTPIEEQFAAIWQEVLQVERVGIYDNFFELGGHSLAAVKLIALIEKEISMKLPLTALFSAPTVASLAETIQEGALTMPSQNDTQDGYSAVALSHAQKVRDLAASQETEWSPLVSIQPHGSRTPLFCVHPSGGTVFCYVPLSQVLGTDQPLYGLQSVGQTGDRSAFEQMETIAAMYLDAIRTVQPSGPYQLIGYSSGGTIAYEMAQQLRTQGEEVSFLGLLDTQIPAATEAPQWLLSYDEVTDQELVYNYLFEQWSAILNPRGMRKLEALSDKGDRLAALITQLQDAGIMPEEVDMYNVVDGIRKEFGYGPAFTSSDDDLLEFLFEEVGDELGKEVIKAVKKLATPSEQLAILIEKADQEELLPVQGGIEALSDYYMMTNTVARSIARYQPQPFDRAITFFKADEQVGDGIFWLAKWWWLRKFKAAGLLNGSDHGWDKLAQGGLDIQTVPGNHFTVLEKPHVNKLAEQIEHTVGNVKESELNNLCIRSLNPSR